MKKQVETLEERYRGDSRLLKFYREKLLIPGWAGELDDTEAAYVAAQLTTDNVLRGLWKKAGVPHRRRKVSPELAKKWAEILATTGVSAIDTPQNIGDRIMKHSTSRESVGSTNLSTLGATKSGPKPLALPAELIGQLASEGLGAKAITTRLKHEGIEVSYKTIQRLLTRQGVLV